jgi:hypothetical protein
MAGSAWMNLNATHVLALLQTTVTELYFKCFAAYLSPCVPGIPHPETLVVEASNEQTGTTDAKLPRSPISHDP